CSAALLAFRTRAAFTAMTTAAATTPTATSTVAFAARIAAAITLRLAAFARAAAIITAITATTAVTAAAVSASIPIGAVIPILAARALHAVRTRALRVAHAGHADRVVRAARRDVLRATRADRDAVRTWDVPEAEPERPGSAAQRGRRRSRREIPSARSAAG